MLSSWKTSSLEIILYYVTVNIYKEFSDAFSSQRSTVETKCDKNTGRYSFLQKSSSTNLNDLLCS